MTNKLNSVLAHYEHHRRMRADRKKRLESQRQQIPDEERTRFKKLLEYGVYVQYEDERMAALDSIKRIESWLRMTKEERLQWFEQAEMRAGLRSRMLDERTAYLQQRRTRIWKDQLKKVDPSWLNEFRDQISSTFEK